MSAKPGSSVIQHSGQVYPLSDVKGLKSYITNPKVPLLCEVPAHSIVEPLLSGLTRKYPRKTTGRLLGSRTRWFGSLGADHRLIQRCCACVGLKDLLNDTVKVCDHTLGYPGWVVHQYANTQIFPGKDRYFVAEVVNTSPMVPQGPFNP